MSVHDVRVVVVDDHEMIRQGLHHAVEGAGLGEVVGEAGSVAAAEGLLDRVDADVAVVDMVLPDGDGIHLCRLYRARHPEVPCLLYTSFPDRQAMMAAVLAGAVGYVDKAAGAAVITDAIRRAAEGETLLDRASIDRLHADLRQDRHDGRPWSLTEQEERVFQLVGLGLSNRQIGERLHLTEATVRNYVSRLLGKLELDRRAEVAALAARLSERRALLRRRPGHDRDDPRHR